MHASSNDPGIILLEPWWRTFAAVCFSLALFWILHVIFMRNIPLIFSIFTATFSTIVMVFGVALFRPLGWGDILWLGVALFISIVIVNMFNSVE